MAITSGANTAIALTIGRLVDAVDRATRAHLPRAATYRLALTYLAVLGVAYLLREGFNVVRRYLVENTSRGLTRTSASGSSPT